jgi:SAM-dependent methyltransferase
MTPSSWLLRFAPLLAPGSRVLDLACGAGRHANYLVEQGFAVTAVDRDAALLAQVDARAEHLALELEDGPWPLAGRVFDAVLVANYLWRPRFSELLACVGDWYLHETFAIGQERIGRPRNPDFLLQPGELFELCRSKGLTVIAYEDGLVNGNAVQRIAARRPGPAPGPHRLPA